MKTQDFIVVNRAKKALGLVGTYDSQKIGNKIRILSTLPDVQKRRAQLKAMHYLFEHGTQNHFSLTIKADSSHTVTASLVRPSGDGALALVDYVSMEPICKY